MKGSGEFVAVKVQHRWIKEQVPGDLGLINIANEVAKIIFPDFKYSWLAEEFNEKLPKELDFRIEANNAIRCKEIFKANNRVRVPDILEAKDRTLIMSFEEGTSVTSLKKLSEQGIDLKDLSKLISDVFLHMIFKEGFCHADPHPGNLMVRAKPNGQSELVLLDHGIYTYLPKDTRLSYTRLWRGILGQDGDMIKEASLDLDCNFHQLFAAMIVDRPYDHIMDKKDGLRMKKRLGTRDSQEAREETRDYAMYYHREIVEILDGMKRELLLVLKTNNYLKAIDKRLGNPNNTFIGLNDITWQVFNKEIHSEVSYYDYYKELFRYYKIKLGLFFLQSWCKVR